MAGDSNLHVIMAGDSNLHVNNLEGVKHTWIQVKRVKQHGNDTEGVKHTWDLGRGSKTYMGFRYVLLPLYQYHVGFLHGIDTEGVKHKWNS